MIEKKLDELLKKSILDLEKNVEKMFSEAIIFRFGSELEFYLNESKELNVDKKIQDISKALKKKLTLFDNIEKEDGDLQFEIIFKPTKNVLDLANEISIAREFLIAEFGVNFNPKPDKKKPGNGMHFHISCFTKDGINLYEKNPIDRDDYFDIFYHSVAGMLEFVYDSMLIFAPSEECYFRIAFPDQDEQHFHYPTNCSWGFNNRTCAIRVTSTISEKYFEKRLENRLASSIANPKLCLISIVKSIEYGILNKLEPNEPIFGNAFSIENDWINNLPRTLEYARKAFQKGRLKTLLNELI